MVRDTGAGLTFEQWQEGVHADIRNDVMWRMEAYRLSLFLSDLAWTDCDKLLADRRTREIADQLCRATGKISAQIAEGYSRTTAKDRVLFYAYALGSLRESRDWYFKSRHVFEPNVTDHRVALCTSVIRLVLATIKNERRGRPRLDE